MVRGNECTEKGCKKEIWDELLQLPTRRAGWEKDHNSNQFISLSGRGRTACNAGRLCPQGNASSGLGVEKEDYEHTVYDMMAEEADLDECLVKNIQDNLDVLPSDMNLAGAEIEFQEVEDKETLLKRYLDKCGTIMILS